MSNHTCLLHTCVCAGSPRVRVRLSGFRRQGISSTPGGFLKCPIPVRVCAEQPLCTNFFIHIKHVHSFHFNILYNPLPGIKYSNFFHRLHFNKIFIFRPLYKHSAGVLCLWYTTFWIISMCTNPSDAKTW
jgi:hypothetical protein